MVILLTSRGSFVGCAIAAILVLAGCGGSLPLVRSSQSSQEALALFEATLLAHGRASFDNLTDVSVAYDGKWRDLVTRFQPVLIDRQFRGSSEERILLKAGVTAQTHAGPGGNKYVYRDRDSVRVWYNGVLETDSEKIAAAAFVADGYRMFLLGPFYFREKNSTFALAGEDTVNGRRCDILAIRTQPGFGFSTDDDYALFIERETRLVQRVRFTARGLQSLRGVVADVDFFDHREVGGVWWPTRFFERLRKPIPMLPVHEWRVTGLDLSRGVDAASISGPAFTGRAVRDARDLKK